MKVPKWVWLLLAAVAIAGGVVAYVAVNLDSYLAANREAIADRVSRALGRSVRFDRLDLSVGRGLGIAVGDLAVGEDARFGDGDFLTARNAFVQIRIVPALFGRYEVARVSLESPEISLVRTADGMSVETLSAGKDDSGSASSAERRAVAVALLDIEDATVRYVDRTRKPAHEIAVRRLDFEASDLSFGDAVRFELSAAAFGAESPNVTASGAVGPVDPADVAATPLDVLFHLDDVDGSALQALVPPTAALSLAGPITAHLEVGGTVTAWTLNFSFHPRGAALAYGGLLDKPRNVELSVTGHLERRADDTIVAEDVAIVTGSSKLTLGGTVTPRERTTPYSLTLNGTAISLADIAALSPAARDIAVKGHADVALGVTTPAGAGAPSVDGRIGLDGVGARLAEETADISQLSGVVSFRGKSATLEPSDLRVGGAPARLSARVADVFAPVVTFELSAPSLPLSVVMADAGDDVLRDLGVSGHLALAARTPALEADVRAASATIRGLAMNDLRGKIAHSDGSSRVDPLAFDTCGGTFRGSLRRATGQDASRPARVELQGNAVRLDIGELATALASVRDRAPASGTLAFEVVAAGTGVDWPSLQETLEGRGRFDIADGAILGTNIPEAALERITGVPGLSALLPPSLRADFPGLFGRKDTRFDALAASFLVANGRLQTQDLTVKSHDFAIDGAGAIGLGLDVDMTATMTASPALSKRLIGEVAAIKLLTNREGNIAVPFRLAGTLPGVKPQPDVAALATRLQRGLVGALGDRLLGGERDVPRDTAPAQ